jgi:hypothetical protein
MRRPRLAPIHLDADGLPAEVASHPAWPAAEHCLVCMAERDLPGLLPLLPPLQRGVPATAAE